MKAEKIGLELFLGILSAATVETFFVPAVIAILQTLKVISHPHLVEVLFCGSPFALVAGIATAIAVNHSDSSNHSL